MESDDRVLERRASQIALAKTEALSKGATITPRTLVEPEKTIPDGGLVEADLPHISIDGRDAKPIDPEPRSVSRADYAIVQTIGEGGMGRVHLARQRSLEREVALKTLKPGSPPEIARALLREARITGSLEHPGVIPVHALGVDHDGKPMLVMKRVDGVDFGKLLRDRAHPAWKARGVAHARGTLVAAIEILIQICRTLELAHSRGIFHRDIKPENVMVGGFGEVYLLDWGIALTASEDTTALVGTPIYMAPEMVRGAPIDARTDVYLLGATLHEVLTEKPRHDGTDVMEVIKSALASSPYVYDASVPDELGDLANRACARDPKDRPPTAQAFREALADFLRHRTARALCDTALVRVKALEDALAEAEGTPPALADAYRLVAEARFGLTESLREHPHDADTRAAMRRCIVAAIELELRQDHADTAYAMLRELDAPDAALAKRAAEAREREAKRKLATEKLATLEREMDPTEKAGMRSLPLLVLAGVALAVTLAVNAYGYKPSALGLLNIGIAFLVAIVFGVVVFRRALLTNTFNRRMTALLVMAGVGVVVDRINGLVIDRPIEQTASADLLLLATMMVSATIAVHRPLYLSTLVFVAGAMIGGLRPDLAIAIFPSVLVVGLVSSAAILRHARRSS